MKVRSDFDMSKFYIQSILVKNITLKIIFSYIYSSLCVIINNSIINKINICLTALMDNIPIIGIYLLES